MKLNKGILAIAILISSALTMPAWSGEKEGNGGQRVTAEFGDAAAEALQILRINFRNPGLCDDAPNRRQFRPICSLNQDQLEQTIAKTKLLAVPELRYMDPNTGQVITYIAQNFPSQALIKISIKQWDSMSCEIDRIQIALHEYLGIMGLETDSYPISGLFRNWLVRHGEPRLKIHCDSSASDCAERISDLAETLDVACFKEFINTPPDPKDDLRRQGDLSICMNNLMLDWRQGFGRICGGAAAQDACMQKCRSYSDSKMLRICSGGGCGRF
jgi:hypothetical protein